MVGGLALAHQPPTSNQPRGRNKKSTSTSPNKKEQMQKNKTKRAQGECRHKEIIKINKLKGLKCTFGLEAEKEFCFYDCIQRE